MEIDEKKLKEKHSEKYLELERQIREKDRAIENYRKDHGKLEVFFNKIIEEITPVIPFRNTYKRTESSKKSKSPTTAVPQISDGHMGANQLSDEIEGFNEFNPLICEERQL